MVWQQFVYLAYIAISALATIHMIGKDREPITNGAAMGLIVGQALMLWLVLSI